MSDENKHSEDEKNSKKGGEFRVPPRTWVVWIAIFGGIILLMLLKERMEAPGDIISQYKFQQFVESNQIVQATVNYNPQNPLNEVVGKYRKDENGRSVETPFRAKVRLTEKMEEKLYEKYPQIEAKEPNTMLMNVAVSVLPFVIIAALIWFFFIRQIKMAGKGALSFGKSKARLLAKERNKTTFKDVAGIDEAIEEVSELVEFLKDPKKFQRL